MDSPKLLLDDKQREILGKAFQEYQQKQQLDRRVQLEQQNTSNSSRRKLQQIQQKLENGGKALAGKQALRKEGAPRRYCLRESDKGYKASSALDENDPNYDSEEDDYDNYYEKAVTEYVIPSEPAYEIPSEHDYPPHKDFTITQMTKNENLSTEQTQTPFPSIENQEASGWPMEVKVMDENVYKEECHKTIKEFFIAEDFGETARIILELNQTTYQASFVKQVFRLSMDYGEKERSLSILLIDYLYTRDIVGGNQIQQALHLLLKSADDIVLDVPKLQQFLSKYIYIAVAKNIIDIKQLKASCRFWAKSNLFKDILNSAENFGEQLGCGKSLDVAYNSEGEDLIKYKNDCQDIIKEYFYIQDLAEVKDSLSELKEPHFSYIFVKQGIRLAMDRTFKERQLVSLMITYLSKKKVLHKQQILRAFVELLQAAPDLMLDVPEAQTYLAIFIALQILGGVLNYQEVENCALPHGPMQIRILNDVQEIVYEAKDQKKLVLSEEVQSTLNSSQCQVIVYGANTQCDKPDQYSEETEYKKFSLDLVKEFFLSEDLNNAFSSIVEKDQFQHNNLFIKSAIKLAMDRGRRQRHQVTLLINYLFMKNIIDREQIVQAIYEILLQADDIYLDVPDVAKYLQKFLLIAIVTQMMEFKDLQECSGYLTNTQLGMQIIQNVTKKVSVGVVQSL